MEPPLSTTPGSTMENMPWRGTVNTQAPERYWTLFRCSLVPHSHYQCEAVQVRVSMAFLIEEVVEALVCAWELHCAKR